MLGARPSRRMGLLLALVLLTSGTVRGLCLMATADDGQASPHACCKKGWRAAPPPCCMADATPEAAARFTTPSPAPALLAASAAAGYAEEAAGGPGALDGASRTHTPPGQSVLRI